MRVAVFSAKAYDEKSLQEANANHGHDLVFLEPRLTPLTAALGAGFPAICAFVSDQLDAPILEELAGSGTRLIALRSAGFNHVDLDAARELGLTVARVPSYSPAGVAEHAVGLILTLNRKLHRAYTRIRDGNFSLEGLMGFEMKGRTIGVVGTGQIGTAFCRIMLGFGCRVLAHDPYPSDEARSLAVEFVDLDRIFSDSDIIALHAPLTKDTHHLIDAAALEKMKPGVMLINTSRGALIDTRAVIEALKSRRLGALGLDVYEEEDKLFFEDSSADLITDDVFARLLTFPNVMITGHQAFFTHEAIRNIAETTLANVTAFEKGEGELHAIEAAGN
jgi:D-lactate dehydrogenase